MYRDLMQDYRTPALRIQRVTLHSPMALFTGTIVNSTYARLDTVDKEGGGAKYIYIYNSHSVALRLHMYMYIIGLTLITLKIVSLGSLTPVSLRSRACFLQGYHLAIMQPDSCTLPYASVPTLFDRIFIENSSLQRDIKMISIRFDVE